MCGFAGEIRLDGASPDLKSLAAMSDVLAPRGPDDHGLFVHGNVGLAHRRLSIMDTSRHAAQPMIDSHLGLGIAFNGAIYNHPELREALTDQGYRFFSTGDTEVILKAWHAWGEDCVHRLQGMFAFMLWERDTGRVVLARDRLGIKPLYWTRKGPRLRAASTLPALLAAGDVDTEVDEVALHHYLSFHAVVPPPHTILRGIRKLPPATLRVIEPDGRERDVTYWEVSHDRSPEDEARSFEDWQEIVLDALRLAVRRRLVADVPVGALLSGGLDSSLIVALQCEAGVSPRTFSIGFEDTGGEVGNEFVYSDIIARQFATEHEQIHIPSSQMLERLPEAVAAMAEPMVSHDCIGFYLLSEAVSRHAKVVQSGQGADEVFGGYHWYPKLEGSTDPAGDYARVFADRDHAEMRRVLTPEALGEDYSGGFIRTRFASPGADDPVDKALRMDTTVMLVDDPVKRVDNMTMAFGLEARVPFLDHELVALAARIPPKFKTGGGGKYVLKEAARRVIPAEVIDRPKGYFPVPALKHISGIVLDYVRDLLNSRACRERGLYQRDYVEALLQAPGEHMTPLGGSKLWQLALLEGWLQQHLR
jgi:asparagine synthase (glutamine-hydrolysing)